MTVEMRIKHIKSSLSAQYIVQTSYRAEYAVKTVPLSQQCTVKSTI